MDRRVTLLLFLSLLFSGAKASVVSLSLKESEQRFSEHNLEVIAERYNIDIAGATDRVERVSFSPLRRGQGGCTIHYRDGDRR
ncbi:hypothetical protein [Parabacteroides distasonis]|uniref:hypothetical protein n=1 Tax=Parabacteroides distasonis TaxID=823 RepID=UPI001E3E5D1C|nr:hypothetical protein [Parabacteroides distasonis]MDB9151869.1 hypothetical protein [Parabacteroides distasonis]MDB9155880.1 hypothetical protein [Parabacteroides distasonis]MDB9164844.1 hypothetical protein [Parabacteroides distasonis]MDB9169430.1 hypothetical protein [Parabacteroides distasonis]MDB9194812.1 hypothetical protein [Parabacteroides distasonis]